MICVLTYVEPKKLSIADFNNLICSRGLLIYRVWFVRESANAVPANKNCALELPTFGVIVGVNQAQVQWQDLTLEEPPS